MKKFDLYVFIIVVLVGIFEFLLGIYIAIAGNAPKNAQVLPVVVLNVLILIYWFRDKKYTLGYYFLNNICANIPMVFVSKIYVGFISKNTSVISTLLATFLFIIFHALVRSFSYQYFKKNSYSNYKDKNRMNSIDNDDEYDYEEIEIVDEESDIENIK